MSYQVFISYRRDGGFETASLIAEKLRNAGFQVFLDIESLRSGKFNEQLYAVIEECTDFIVVLPRDGLERCVNEEDWVKKEVRCAIQHQKNIIPVLLKGFAWPDRMPAGLEGLSEYQGVAAGNYEYFDAAVERLKKYLKSSPGGKLNKKLVRWGKGVGITVLLLGLIAWGVRQLAIPVCVEQANKVTFKMGVIDLLATESDKIYEAWKDYCAEYEKAGVEDTVFLNAQMRQTLNFYRNEVKKLQRDTTLFQLADDQRILLRLMGVETTDIEAFHHTFYPTYFDDIYQSIGILEAYLNIGEVSQISVATAEVNMKSFRHAIHIVYYGYLVLMSQMPEKALKTYHEVSPSWANFPSTVGLYLPLKEYERLEKGEEEKLKVLSTELGAMNTQQTRELEKEKKKLERMKEKVARIQQVKQLSADVSAKQNQLQETEKQIEATFRRVIEKCELKPEDGQYEMWGKIVRIATLMGNTANRRQQMAEQNRKAKAQAEAKGFDTSGWFQVEYGLTMEEVLKEVYKRLDQYQAYFPETRAYVPAVKQFYTEVAAGKCLLEGMVVIATKDDLPHPVLQIGDIVTARKGKVVNNTTDYKAAKEIAGEDQLTFWRFSSDGKWRKQTESIPLTEVLVGFLMLKEE